MKRILLLMTKNYFSAVVDCFAENIMGATTSGLRSQHLTEDDLAQAIENEAFCERKGRHRQESKHLTMPVSPRLSCPQTYWHPAIAQREDQSLVFLRSKAVELNATNLQSDRDHA